MPTTHVYTCSSLIGLILHRCNLTFVLSAFSLEYWAIELLVLIAGLLPNSTASTSLIAIWYGSGRTKHHKQLLFVHHF